MNIESTSVGKAMVVKVSGRIDAQTTDQFGAACKRLIQDGATHVVVTRFTEIDDGSGTYTGAGGSDAQV